MYREVTEESVALKRGLKTGEVKGAVDSVLRSMKPVERDIAVTEKGRRRVLKVKRTAVGVLVTGMGRFYQLEFEVSDRWKRYSVIFFGDIGGDFMPDVRRRSSHLVRLDSGCETGQITGDVTCDCSEQLLMSMRMVAENGEGFIIRMPLQEGKGTGVGRKLAAHLLEDRLGISNVEAAMLLSGGRSIDTRTYYGAIAVLKFLGVSSPSTIRIMTNNPKKLLGFEENGYRVARVPLRIAPNRFTRIHLKAKQDYLGHIGLV